MVSQDVPGNNTPSLDTGQLLRALVAVKQGDFSARLPVEWTGIDGKIADTFNDIVMINQRMAQEFERLGQVVGKEGKITQRAALGDVTGSWAGMVGSVNTLVDDLVRPTSEMARVIGAVAKGDLSKNMELEVEGRPLQGEFLRTARTVNTMVDQLNSFASEVTRVAREVGTDGKLGGQADVKGVSGTWKDLTDNVNLMASNLTSQVRNIADVTVAVANGDLGKKITVDARGEILELKNTINLMVDQLNSFASEVTRVAREVGTEGKLGGQAFVPGVGGTWKDLTDNVNLMASNLTSQVRNISQVATAIANGDLNKKITVDARGEILELKDTINLMVDRLNSFASEVTRLAREVGTDGKLGGQAQVKGVGGVWQDLTDNLNLLAGNLTDQVRDIALVATAIANGDLGKKITVDARGEILELKDTINTMVDQLNSFASEVTRVAREVGTDGKLGGQADVKGVGGTWQNLTDNVNLLAANLTSQVRAIADVATAVTQGDLTREVKVDARGEVAELKDNINEMIRNLRDTTQRNTEQDWLKTNLARFTRMLQGQRDLMTVSKLILSELAPLVNAAHGVFYIMDAGQDGGQESKLKLLATYAYKERKNLAKEFRVGEGLVGECAYEKERILLTNVPSDYVQINSGLGEATPLNIVVLPVLFESQVRAVIELASFERYSATHQAFLDQLMESIGIVLNTLEANLRTEGLLKQSQSLAAELQSQQEELQQTNEELAEKARLLGEQNAEVERKNREVEMARRQLEEKAEQLALTSRYKSEFVSNMSHELRTPLNSLLILSQQLAQNPDGNLSDKQVDFARTIYTSGQDLLGLINDILDLSKIESGTVTLDLDDVEFARLGEHIVRTFQPMAESKRLSLALDLDSGLPPGIFTDEKRLQQVLKNLISNAIKFTEQGQVTVAIRRVAGGWNPDAEALNRAPAVLAFSVTDTGIGIPPDKQKIIFEAFQQADGSTSRKYGGTGLGLSISREIAYLLGGDIGLTSIVGKGSTFTLYLPQEYRKLEELSSGGADYNWQRSLSALGETADTRLQRPAITMQRRAGAIASESSRPDTERVPRTALVDDDRERVGPGDHVVLIAEDDASFARILLDMAHAKGFKGVIALQGDEALTLARQLKPEAMTLDLNLPVVDGWTILDRIKLDPATRHIPVHIITVEGERERGLQRGALAFLGKPVTADALEDAFGKMVEFLARPKKLLVVDDDLEDRQGIVDLIGNGDVLTTAVASGEEALAALRAEHFDCMVLDLNLPGISGLDVMQAIQQDPALQDLPIIVYTGKKLTRKEETQLRRMARTIVVKGVQSPERLLDETSLFLHRVAARLPERKRHILEQLHNGDAALAGKKLLIVDDDVRNVFALTALLERHGVTVLPAETGKEALSALQAGGADVDLVLMDVMMPEMDGYDTMRAMRKMPGFKSLPIIALTAKAMKGDRDKCIEAGASDYIAKPVDGDQLLSLLRVWLYHESRP